MRNGLAAVLIVKNEEKVLDRCLRSISEVDEIIILDTGSTDRTIEVAKAHTSKVFEAPSLKEGESFHFANARNMALQYARQDWILTIDADEIAHPGCIQVIRKAFFRYGTANIFDVRFIISNEGGKDPASLPKPKVFRRGQFDWQSRIHERLVARKPPPRGQYLEDAVMEHLPLVGQDKEARRAQNLELLKLSVKEEPMYLRNSRQLGMELFAREEYREAIKWLELYIQSGVGGPYDRSETLMHIARCHSGIGVLEDALKYFDLAVREAPDRREPHYFRGMAILKEARTPDDVRNARESFLAAERISYSAKPDYYLNVENIWDGTYTSEAIQFCTEQLRQADEKLAGMKKSQG